MSAAGQTTAWVREHLGLGILTGDPGAEDLYGLALRRNPQRLHLVVSPVLAKHVPVTPDVARDAADRLAARVAQALGGETPSLVLGYAETATGLGHLVAEQLAVRGLAVPYLHSTRRPAEAGATVVDFEEEHSHATTHRLLPTDPALLTGAGPVVLVDDEVTTGTTARNTVAVLQRLAPRLRFVVAALLDLRPAAEPAAAVVAGAEMVHVALLRGEARTLGERDDRVTEVLTAAPPSIGDSRHDDDPRGDLAEAVMTWPAGLPDGGRHGFGPEQAPALGRAVATIAEAVAAVVTVAGPVHVLGTEELMHLPLLIAEHLTTLRDAPVTVSSTTRSPVVVLDDPGYAVQHGIAFCSHDGGSGPDDAGARYAYNLAPGAFAAIIVVLDGATPRDGATDLLDRLRRLTGRVVVLRLRPAVGG